VVENAHATQVCGSLLELVIEDLLQRDSLRDPSAFECRRFDDGWTYCFERLVEDDRRDVFVYDETGLLGVGRGRWGLIGADTRSADIKPCP
jgi:hypothetical protein